MNDFTFNILKIVIAVAVAMIARYLVPYIKAKIEEDKYAQLVVLVHTAVQAAEQTLGPRDGALKKEQVVKFITEYMNKVGVIITDKQLDNLIEAAVFQMNLEIK